MFKVMVLVFLVSNMAFGSDFYHNDKKVTKGHAIMILAKDPKAVIKKVDFMELNSEKGTLKALKEERVSK